MKYRNLKACSVNFIHASHRFDIGSEELHHLKRYADLTFICTKPLCIKTNIGSGSVRIAKESSVNASVPGHWIVHRRSVKVAVLGIKSCLRMAGLNKIFSALLGSSLPKLFVLFICPLCKKLIEMRQMIRRIRERMSRNKKHKMIVPIPHRCTGPAVFAFMNTGS